MQTHFEVQPWNILTYTAVTHFNILLVYPFDPASNIPIPNVGKCKFHSRTDAIMIVIISLSGKAEAYMQLTMDSCIIIAIDLSVQCTNRFKGAVAQ